MAYYPTSAGRIAGAITAVAALAMAAPLKAAETPSKLLFGDTHVHTSYSFDAYLNQNRSADPDTAFRYARGLPVIHPFHRARVQIGTPLDFMVVSDHAELLGFMPTVDAGTAQFEDLGLWGNLKRWASLKALKWVMGRGMEATKYFADMLPPSPETVVGDPVKSPMNVGLTDSIMGLIGDTSVISSHAWKDITETADYHNIPGVFSAFSGWEWSSIPVGVNLHRVVITPESATLSQQYLPYGADLSQYPEDLWSWLDSTSAKTGARFLAIPHNSNISKGYMFADTTLKGNVMTAEYARNRLRWEPLTEITQIKGDSETHPDLSPEDPFADFEPFPFYLQISPAPYVAAPGDYVRSALKTGLQIESRIGVNPYRFGVIGSTDSHTGLASAEEDNFWGKLAIDSIPENKTSAAMKTQAEEAGITILNDGPGGWDMSASGLAAVWATENTREAIFEAMQRREVYGTTGPRLQLRFFAGWAFEHSDAASIDLAAVGYEKGIPMGSQLPPAPNADAAPSFLIQVAKDPVGANVEHVQVIKGWIDGDGESQEQVYTVNQSAVSGLGEASVTRVWLDPDFEPGQSAFYYLRVLQVPTPRHSYYDKLALKMEPTDGDHIRERAYSSSVWYVPPGSPGAVQ
jgi:Protein of unknown function (DUF3604)